ncbi:hypothetical protein TNIN_67121 [Trichonephila inaurata madagascariensis]|uniref:Uncharacterized protein n=1 Tax=Trichonephila inaurata madagascariensis TaxID=2747483 RepID=A0A8X7BSS6_9ARAC|nr:hypothetical protein TNIN_67121 [Trichonephila inaurata madagascariensis]
MPRESPVPKSKKPRDPFHFEDAGMNLESGSLFGGIEEVVENENIDCRGKTSVPGSRPGVLGPRVEC